MPNRKTLTLWLVAVCTLGTVAFGKFSDSGLVKIPSPGPIGWSTYAFSDVSGGVRFVTNYFDVFTSKHVLWRANADGAFDTSFGDKGLVPLRVPGAIFMDAQAHAQQKNGDTVLAGAAYFDGESDVLAFRLQKDGTLDKTFGDRGYIRSDRYTDGYEIASALFVDAEDRIWVIGQTFGADGRGKSFVTRFRANGKVDLSFQDAGLWELPPTAGTLVKTTFHDGYLYMLALGSAAGGEGVFRVSRLDRDGRVDLTWGHKGSVALGAGLLYTSPLQFEVDDSGRFLLVGSLLVDGDIDVVFYRCLSDGSLDKSFGVDGKATVDVHLGSDDYFQTAFFAPSGETVVVGYTGPHKPLDPATLTGDTFLIRFNSAGEMDTHFGVDGVVRRHLPDFNSYYASWFQEAGGKIFGYWHGVGLGTVTDGVRAVRFRPDGTLDL